MEFLCLPANPPKAAAALLHFTPAPDAAAQWSCQLAAPMDSDDLHCCDEDLSGIPLHSAEDNSRLPNTTDDEEEEDNATSKQESHLTNSNKLQKKDNSLYALRRNPKRSRRFIDQEYALDISVNSSGPSPALPAPKKNSSSMFADKARACTECGKEFSSWKALFGHMRCHPEREWRGIQRPDNLSDYKFAKSSGTAARRKKARQTAAPAEEELEAFYIKFSIPSDDSDTESIEAAYINGTNGFHSTRPKIITGKRSKRLPKTSLTTTTTTASEERDMARCLVMLAQHKSSSSLSFEEESDQEGTSTTNNNNHVASTNENNLHPVSSGEMDNEQLVAGTSDTQQQQRPHLEHYHSPVPPLDDMCTPTELLEHDLDGIRMKYECSTCKRIFKSHQALGGHRASHKKVKGCFAKTNSPLGEGSIVPIPSLHQQHVECTNEEDLADEDFLRTDEQILPMDFPEHHLHLPLMPSTAPHTHLEALTTTFRFKDEFESTTSRKMSNIKGHECSICHRVFTSGQALGGHKRCHWGGSEQRPIPEQSSVVKPMTEQPSLVKPITHFMSHVVGDIAGILNSSTNTKLAPGASLGREEFLDLNLPAMVDDECEHREHRKEEGSGKSISAAALEVIHKLPQLLPLNNVRIVNKLAVSC